MSLVVNLPAVLGLPYLFRHVTVSSGGSVWWRITHMPKSFEKLTDTTIPWR
jgi:hypothetical protein